MSHRSIPAFGLWQRRSLVSLAFSVVALRSIAVAADNQPVDIALNGQFSLNCNPGGYCVSEDGRYVAFGSSCPQLVAGITSSVPRVYLRDMVLGTTILVSRASNGAIPVTDQANVGSISDDGRFVLFSSPAGLTSNASVNGSGVYLFDRTTNGLELISVGSDGLGYQGFVDWTDRAPMMTPDGRYVVFNSFEALTSDAGISFAYRVYLRDRVTQQTTLVSPPAATNSFGLYFAGGILADGSKVLYRNAGGGAGALKDFGVFVRDRVNGTTLTVYLEPSPPAQFFQGAKGLDWSADGKLIVFDMVGAHPSLGDTDVDRDIFVANVSSGTSQIELASVPQPGHGGVGGFAMYPSLSNDGRYLAFWALGPEFVPWTSTLFNPSYPCVRDLVTQRNCAVAIDAAGKLASASSFSPAISGDGRFVVFVNFGSALFANTFGDHIYRADRIGTTGLGYGKPGFGSTIPALIGNGTFLPGTAGSLLLTGAAPSAPGLLLLSLDRTYTQPAQGPFVGTTLATANPLLVVPIATDGLGQWSAAFQLPTNVPLVPEVYLQAAIADPQALNGASVSTALRIGM